MGPSGRNRGGRRRGGAGRGRRGTSSFDLIARGDAFLPGPERGRDGDAEDLPAADANGDVGAPDPSDPGRGDLPFSRQGEERGGAARGDGHDDPRLRLPEEQGVRAYAVPE